MGKVERINCPGRFGSGCVGLGGEQITLNQASFLFEKIVLWSVLSMPSNK